MARHAEPVTELLSLAEAGDGAAAERLWEVVYQELRRLAVSQLAGDKPGVGPQATTLVHEAYLRLVGTNGEPAHWNSRRHFFAAAAIAMRRIRVDAARERKRIKRGSGRSPLSLDAAAGASSTTAAAEVIAAPPPGDYDAVDLIVLDEALRKLEALDPRKAEIVNLRYFAGMTVDETAELMGLSARTIDLEWRFARAWLHRELAAGD